MDLQFIDHFTLSVQPHELAPLRKFYTETFGLKEGRRPSFDFPGHWLYMDGRPVVHLAANLPAEAAPPDGTMATGKFNHVSFRCKNTEAVRRKLRAQGIPFREAPVPEFPMHQIFLHDPAGLMIELTFMLPETPALKTKRAPARHAAARTNGRAKPAGRVRALKSAARKARPGVHGRKGAATRTASPSRARAARA